MLTRREAVEMALKKWSKKEGFHPLDPCGFCEYFKEHNDSSCRECPLSKDICYQYYRRRAIYWQIKSAFDKGRLYGDLKAKMLQAIKERGKKWIEEEQCGK